MQSFGFQSLIRLFHILNKFKESIFPAKTKQYYKRKYYLCTQVKLYTYRNENF